MLTEFGKQLKLPTFGGDPQTRSMLIMWINSVPTNDDVAKLISTRESVMNHYINLLKEPEGESA
jgi:hypothetical protein